MNQKIVQKENLAVTTLDQTSQEPDQRLEVHCIPIRRKPYLQSRGKFQLIRHLADQRFLNLRYLPGRKRPSFASTATSFLMLNGLATLRFAAMSYCCASMTFTDSDSLSYLAVGKSLPPKSNRLFLNLMVSHWTMFACICNFHSQYLSQTNLFPMFIGCGNEVTETLIV